MEIKKKCDKCPYELDDIKFKPSLYHKAQRFRPLKTKVLFIAESPPSLRKGLEKDLQPYFYNENLKTTRNNSIFFRQNVTATRTHIVCATDKTKCPQQIKYLNLRI